LPKAKVSQIVERKWRKQMKENFKSNTGITLIALIITIIILVILAAVSIRAVYNMGIVGHAINGTQQYAEGAKAENKMLGDIGSLIDNAVSKIKEIQAGEGIALNKSKMGLQLISGQTVSEKLTATLLKITGNIAWTSSNTAAATVSNDGTVTAVAVGKTTITAKVTSNEKEYSASCEVEVTTEPVTNVELSATTGTLDIGQNLTLTATVTPSTASNQGVTWSSSDTNVATVENGVVTAVGAGSATITATANDGSGYNATCAITVNPRLVSSITLNETTKTLNVGDTLTLTASVEPNDATNKNVTWSTSDSSVATVDNNGKVTAKGAESATITATAADGSGITGTCEITVNAPVAQSVGAGERVATKTNYTVDNKTAVIPAGWTVSGKTGDPTTKVGDETTIDTGLVIYFIPETGEGAMTDEQIAAIDWTDSTVTENLRKTYDQFVWIPIPRANINKMFMCQGKTADTECDIALDANGEPYCKNHSTNNTKMAGRLYAKETGEKFNASLTTQTYNANSGLREPAIVTGNDTGTGTKYDGATSNGTMTNLSQISTILGTGTDPNEKYDSAANFLITLQNEYNAIVKSVYENEGFWVGRYETSGMASSNTVGNIKIVAGSDNTTNANISKVNWYRMYAQQKKYAENRGMLGGMIQGAAFDQMLKFADTDTNYSVTTKGQVAHGSSEGISNVYPTGNTAYPSGATKEYKDIANNIYDLEGNVREWTTEATRTSTRIFRGGYCLNSDSASYRDYNLPGNNNAYVGSRSTLYIK